MDLQTRKLNAIEYLIHLQDEEVFRKIEKYTADREIWLWFDEKVPNGIAEYAI